MFYDTEWTDEDHYPTSTIECVFSNEKYAKDYIESRALEWSDENITGETKKEKMKWMRDQYHIEEYELDNPYVIAKQ